MMEHVSSQNKDRFVIFILCLMVYIAFSVVSCGRKLSYRDQIYQAASWIRASAVQTENGTTWPAVPGDNETIIRLCGKGLTVLLSSPNILIMILNNVN